MLKALVLSIMIDLLHPSIQIRSYEHEPLSEAQQRYDSIAEDITQVAMDDSEPPLFTGPAAREATAVLLGTIAWHESGFRKDVDNCRGTYSKGDHGRSITLLQVMSGPNYEGHSSTEICEDRRLAIRLGLHVLRRAKNSCNGGLSSPRIWLQSYGAGGCNIRSNVSRDICTQFERVGRKYFDGLSCASAGPVTLRETTGS